MGMWDEIEPHLNSMDAELTFWLNIMKNKASKRNLDIRGLQKVKRMQAITTID